MTRNGGPLGSPSQAHNNEAIPSKRIVACSEIGKFVSAQCPSVFIACPKEGRRVCTQRPLVFPVCPPAIGIVDPEITNSSHTGRVHGKAVSRNREGPLSRKRISTGCVSGDNLLHAKTYGRTSHLMESGSCYDPTHKGPTSWDSLPANKHGTMMPAQRGSPTTVDGGRVSGTQDMHALPPAFWREIGFGITCGR